MKINQTTLAAGIFVVLALAYYLTQTGAVDTRSIDPDKFVIDEAKLTAIAVSTPTGKLEFVRTGVAWKLDNYPVDTMRMNSFLDQITALELDRMITRNPEKQSKYEVDEQSTHLILKGDNGSILLDLILGKQGANYQENFVRAAGENEVYAVKSNLGSYRTMEASRFWDRTMTDLDVNQITQVTFEGELNYLLQREGPVWTFDGKPVDLDKVTNMLKALENLRANNFRETITDENPFYQSIQIKLESGQSIDLVFHLKDEQASSLLVGVTDRTKVFEYSKSGLNRFKKEYEDLIADPRPTE